MQRIAMSTLVVALLIGCSGNPATKYDRPLPDPLLTTKKSEQPVRPGAAAPVRPGSPPAAWTPPGGIKRSMWKCIVVHHSASDKATPQSMNSWHLQRGWENGLGYHFVIGNGVNYPDGQIFVGPRWRSQQEGAHCKNAAGKFFGLWRKSGYYNDHGIGICLIGDFDKGRPTAKQRESLARLTAFLCAEAGVSPDHVHGHGEVTGKTKCPGTHLDVAWLRRSVKQINASSR